MFVITGGMLSRSSGNMADSTGTLNITVQHELCYPDIMSRCQINCILINCIKLVIFALGSLSHLTRAIPEIDILVVLDRDIDLYSPMVTPLTYEGLIDEIIGDLFIFLYWYVM